jgi:hypothetical protein
MAKGLGLLQRGPKLSRGSWVPFLTYPVVDMTHSLAMMQRQYRVENAAHRQGSTISNSGSLFQKHSKNALTSHQFTQIRSSASKPNAMVKTR